MVFPVAAATEFLHARDDVDHEAAILRDLMDILKTSELRLVRVQMLRGTRVRDNIEMSPPLGPMERSGQVYFESAVSPVEINRGMLDRPTGIVLFAVLFTELRRKGFSPETVQNILIPQFEHALSFQPTQMVRHAIVDELNMLGKIGHMNSLNPPTRPSDDVMCQRRNSAPVAARPTDDR